MYLKIQAFFYFYDRIRMPFNLHAIILKTICHNWDLLFNIIHCNVSANYVEKINKYPSDAHLSITNKIITLVYML